MTASTRAVDDSVCALVLSAFVAGVGLMSSPGEEGRARGTADSESYTFVTVSTAGGSCCGVAKVLEDDCSLPITSCAAWCRSAAARSSAVCRDRHAYV